MRVFCVRRQAVFCDVSRRANAHYILFPLSRRAGDYTTAAATPQSKICDIFFFFMNCLHSSAFLGVLEFDMHFHYFMPILSAL
jgi:hypothetical protein